MKRKIEIFSAGCPACEETTWSVKMAEMVQDQKSPKSAFGG